MQRTPTRRRARLHLCGPAVLLRRFGLVLLLALLPGWSLAAGFDCAKAASPIEQAICADAALSLADFVLTERYQFLASHCKAMPGASERVEEQRRWVAQVRRDFAPTDAGREALRASYHQRNAELERDLAACTLRRRDAAPVRVDKVGSPTSDMQLPWVEAASPEVSRRINDVVFQRMLDTPAPARPADAVALLPKPEQTQNAILSSEYTVVRNDGRLLVLAVAAEGCFRHCGEHFTEQWNFDARTGRQLENDTLFTPAGKKALMRYYVADARAKFRAALARVKKAHDADEDEFEHYTQCAGSWSQDATLPEPRLDAAGHWQLPTPGCSFGYRPQWNLLDGIDVPLPESMLARSLSAYGRSVLLGQGDVRDPTPPAPRCVRAAATPFAAAPAPYRSLAFGDGHGLALLADGSVVTWGEDEDGQLGRGEERRDNQAMPPQIVAGGMVAVAAGQHWSAALGDEGTLWTWGSNYMGSLGRETPGERLGTKPVALGHDFVQVRAASDRGLALKRDGSLWAWGGRIAQRWPNGAESYVTTPWRLGDGYAHIELGAIGDVQAIDRDGTLWVWGGNPSDGRHLPEDTPRELGQGFARLAGHGLQAAFKTDGSLWAWGESLAAMIDTAGERDRPPQRVGDGFVQVVGAPENVVAALKSDGSVWLTHVRGRVTQLEQVTCGAQRIALVGASWDSPSMKVQVVVLRDDGSLVAWPVGSDVREGVAQVRASAAAPLKLGEGFRQLDMVDGQAGNRGPELLAVDGQGQVWQRRYLRDQPPPANPHDWLVRVDLPPPTAAPAH